MSDSKNLLFIISDQHSRNVLGSYGNRYAKTPNIDRLAEEGTQFNNSYCNFPICVPSRASCVIGDYASRHGYWDNAHGYAGETEGYGHLLRDQGFDVTTIGKLHFKDNTPETGFSDQRLPMNIHQKVGDVQGCIRDDRIRRKVRIHTVTSAGPGDSDYSRFDKKVADSAAQFLKTEAGKKSDKPWMLYVGFVTPHFPLTVPQEFWDLYEGEDSVPFPFNYEMDKRPMHPVIEFYRRCNCLDNEFDSEIVSRAVRAYYGLVSFMDHQVGIVLKALEESGLKDSTRVIYCSDHGDTMGDNGLFFKHTMYEGSVGVPLILSGPDIPQNVKNDTLVSLVDVYPTVIDGMGAEPKPGDNEKPGMSLIQIAKDKKKVERSVFAEYHAVAINAATYMIRRGNMKLVYYVGFPSQLFDLKNDPREENDLVDNPEYQDIKAELEAEIRSILDPEETDKRARIAQKKMVDANGGEEAFVGKPKKYEYSPVPEEYR